jgi:hypothetical protein
LKRQSNTTQSRKQRDHRFFLDRNLGSLQLPLQLRTAGINITIHDDIYARTERDPWIFYDCGKKGLIVITSDKKFTKFFPHMAAIALGKTTVLFFSNNKWHSQVRGDAFLKAHKSVIRTLNKQTENFIGCIRTDGTFKVVDKKPRPSRKLCDPKDWDSYRRVCQMEGVVAEEEGKDEKVVPKTA